MNAEIKHELEELVANIDRVLMKDTNMKPAPRGFLRERKAEACRRLEEMEA